MTVLTIAALSLSLFAASSTALAIDVQDSKATTAAPATDRDVICGMNVDTAKAKAAGRTSQYEGKTYYFCNDSCKKQFDAEPAKYAAQAKEKTEASAGNDGDGCCCCCGNGAMAKGAMGGGGMAGGGMCGRRMR